MNLLYVLHSDPAGAVGGTELHVTDLISALSGRHAIFVLFRRGEQLVVREYSGEAPCETSFALAAPEGAFLAFLRERRIDLVHFHHFLGLPPRFLELARSQTRTLVSLHDYFAYCENFDFLDSQDQFCGYRADAAACDACIAKTARAYRAPGFVSRGHTQERRAQFAQELLEHPVVFPSSHARERMEALLKIRHPRAYVIEPPLRYRKRLPTTGASTPPSPLCLAFVGVFETKKGSQLFASIVQRANLRFPQRLRWLVFGRVRDHGSAAALCAEGNVRFLGEYRRERIVALLGEQGVHVGCLLSIWPETYSFALSEIFLAGLPAMVTALGAPEQRVRMCGAGWSISPTHAADDAVGIIRSLLADPEALARATARVPVLPDADEQVAALEALCLRLVPQRGEAAREIPGGLELPAMG